MYKIINGYLYDTEKSEKLTVMRNTVMNRTDGLYKTKNGKYFECIYGNIFPRGRDYIKEKLSDNLEIYTKHFGEPKEA